MATEGVDEVVSPFLCSASELPVRGVFVRGSEVVEAKQVVIALEYPVFCMWICSLC